MGFKRFRTEVIIRVILLALIMAGEAYALFQTDWLVTSILGVALIVLQVAELIHYVNKTNRDLSNFLQSIQHHDFTASFSAGKRGASFDALKDAFNGIIKEFQTLRAEKESHYQYLQTVIENIGVALICFDQSDEVILMNQASKELLAKPYIHKIGALERVDEQMLSVIRKLSSGEKELIKVVVQGELLQISIQATEFKLLENSYKLISLQDIRNELDSREVDAWQKLIRVLTHEIMNSVTPLSTLSGVLKDYLRNEEGDLMAPEQLDAEHIDDLSTGLETIESRTRGLLKFVRAYRSILRIPKPNFQEVLAQDLVSRTGILLRDDLKGRNIELTLQLPEEPLAIQVDPDMIEQVLINLVKNAMEALNGSPNAHIELIVAQPRPNKTVIQVRDNGPGIEEEFVDKVFIPFFTTKKEGSGIGLSLSRQIMRMHKGVIALQTHPEEGTLFSLEF